VNALVVMQGLLIYALLAWKLSHLARAPRDIPLRCVIACLGCAAAAYPFGVAFSHWSALAGARWLMLAQYSLLLGVVYALDCFFVFSLRPAAAARQRAARRAGALTSAVVLMGAAAAAVPSGTNMNDQSVPAVAVVYLIFDVAMACFLADAWLQARQGIRHAGPPVSRGLRLASAGLALMAAGLVPLTAVIVIRQERLSPPAPLIPAGQFLVVTGIVVFLAGVCYPGAIMRFTAARVWARHRRLYRQLTPLWNALHEAFPQHALARVPAGRWHEALTPWGMHRRYYRRVIECRDGLVRISPYLAGTQSNDRTTLGDRLLAVLRALPAADGVPRQAVPVAIPQLTGLDADAAELAALASQLPGARRHR
jgi:hypothetical protein